jgi:tetratricopeptide (TPR) repeat protein
LAESSQRSRIRSEPDAAGQARRLYTEAIRQTNLSRPARAIQLLKRALAALALDERSTDSTLRARIYVTLALNQAELHGASAGSDSLSEAARIAEDAVDHEIKLIVEIQRGLIAMRSGDLETAISRLDEAIRLLEFGSPFERAITLINRGALLLYLGDLAKARLDLDMALSAAQEAELPLEAYKAKHNLGYLEFLAGNIPLAIRLLDDAARETPHAFGAAQLDRARVLVEAGLTREAGQALDDAALVVRRQRQAQDIAEIELAQAECALLGGEVSRARRLAASSRIRFRRLGSERWRQRAQMLQLQADLAGGRPGARLAPPALALAEEMAQSGSAADVSTAYRMAAQALIRAGRLPEARDAAIRAGPVRATSRISARLHARLVRAELEIADGALGRARRELRTGLHDLASYQARFGSIDLQTASAVHGRRLAELDVATALHSGRPGDVLIASERSRATTTRIVHLKPPADPAEADMLSTLRLSLVAAREARSAQDVAAEATHRQQAAGLQQRLRGRSWTSEGSGQAVAVATLAEIRAKVAELDARLLVYVESNSRLFAVCVGHGPSTLVEIGAADEAIRLARRVHADFDVLALDRLPGPLLRAAQSSLRSDLRRLDELLFSRLRVSGGPLVIVPAGELRMLPWNALPSRSGLPTVVAASASAWCRTTALHAPTAAPTVAAIAGPALARASEEVQVVADTWPGVSVSQGVKADRQAALSAMAEADLVHVAAHGTHQTESPLFSFVRLADGPVFAHELDPDTVRASHVVLSACEVGRSTLRPGDEALGLTSVLLRLGVRSVVAGVARVNDTAAAETMAAYHRELARGAGSAEALASALAGTDDETPVPFVCFGASWQAASPA